MVKSCFLAFVRYLASICSPYVLSRSVVPKDTRQATNVSDDGLCPTVINTNFCQRCIDRKIQDKKRCITTELAQRTSDNRHYTVPAGLHADVGSEDTDFPAGQWEDTLAKVDIDINGTEVELAVNIDSCRKVHSDTRVGPLVVCGRRNHDVTMQQLVDQLFSLSNEAAIDVVLSNAKRGKKAVKDFLDGIAPLGSPVGVSLSPMILR